MKNEKQPIHYAWLILIALCFLCFASGGILYNCIGIFMTPICRDLNISTTQFSMYLNIRQIVMVILLPVSGYLLPRMHPRYLLTGAGVCGVASLLTLASVTQLWQLYLSGALCGTAAAFLIMTTAPILLKRWFKKKYSLAISIAMAFNGVGGIVMNPVGAIIMEHFGWRSAAFCFAAVSALFIFPCTLFVLKKEPAEIGLLPYGVSEKDTLVKKDYLSDKRNHPLSSGMGILLLILLNAMLIAIPQAFNSHCSQFGISIGFSAVMAAGMSSALMAGNTLGKIALGWLAERCSSFKSILIGAVLVVIGFILLVLPVPYVVLLAASFLGGISMSMTSIAVPLMVADFYDGLQYDMVLYYATMSSMFITGIALSLIGLGYDTFGSYQIPLYFMIIIYILLMIFLKVLYQKKSNRYL